MSVRCFHCGLPVPTDRAYPIRYENMEQAGCCRGCQAVAQTIIGSGQVIDGHSSVSEALLTGEAHPISKAPGGAVVGGSLNQTSPLIVRVDKLGTDTRLAAIERLLDRAQSEKPRLARLADRAAAWFVSVLLVISALVAAAWYVIDPTQVLWITVSILVVTCPCALGLATPAALTAATARLTRLGLLTTRGHALETLARVSDIVFDKTGTLTHGTLRVSRVIAADGHTNAAVRAMAATMEAGAEHPIARALRELHPSDDTPTPAVTHIQNHPGKGVAAQIGGVRMRLGSPGFAAEITGHTLSVPGNDTNESWVALADEHGVLAWFALADTLRADAAHTVSTLKQLGIRIHLLSGDGEAVVAATARALELDTWQSDALPETKLAYVKNLQSQGRIVAMVGDGINDALVLAAAQISIATGEGAEVAQAAADMVMLGKHLSPLAEGVALARKTRRIIYQNLAWALATT